MKRQIIVEVDCGEKECGECEMDVYYDGHHCHAFEKSEDEDDVRGDPNRLPTCLASEAKLKQLIEAAEGVLKEYVSLVESGDAGFWNPETVDSVIAVRAALKEVKGE